MKDFIKKQFGWMKESNCPKYVKAGMLVFIAMLVVYIFVEVSFTSTNVIPLW